MVRVGYLGAADRFGSSATERRRAVERVASLGYDHVSVGDHVSFWVGAGSDGLVDAASLLSMHDTLPVYVGVYLLPLRHPVLVARQLASISEFAPGRLRLGVGVGGEDRHEVEVCGVDPATRGRRMDECIEVLRGLGSGQPFTYRGTFFDLEEAQIVPAPDPPVPLVVGGRSDAAIRRAGRLGDGWLGVWVSPRRFAEVVGQIGEVAASAGRGDVEWRHGMNVWCGVGATAEAAREHVAAVMSAVYQLPFEKFEKWSPYGTPDDVAEFLAPYVEAGCTDFNLIVQGESVDAAVEGGAAVAKALRGS